ncbi:MAG: sigma-70 family RNA polymerase sigma factor [Elusimicrobiota bacterium]
MYRAINQDPGEDGRLIAAFLAEDSSAFDKLVLKYKDRVFNICYRFMGNHDDANDCAQDAFVKVFRSLKHFKGESLFSTWLYSITVNTCKNKLSSLAHRIGKRMVQIDKRRETEDGEKQRQFKDDGYTPPEMLEMKEREAKVQKAIGSLGKYQKELIILRDIEDLSYEEIAKITGHKLGTVKSGLSRARFHLKEKLRELR